MRVCVWEREKECVCAWARTGCRRARWIRVALAEREEANRLHYANAVQLQLTVAKNRCRYRGMLSRTPREFLHSSFPLFLVLVRFLFISLNAFTLVPQFGLHPDGMKRRRGCRSNRYFLIRALHCRKSPFRFISLSLSPLATISFPFSYVDVLIIRLFSRTFP